MKRSVVLPLLVLFLVGCEAEIKRVEWPVMGTIAALQTRGGSNKLLGELKDAVENRCYQQIIAEFNAHDPNSQINREGHCSAFGQECEKAAYLLMYQSLCAFNPQWRDNGKPDFGAIAKGFAVDLACKEAKALTNRDMLLDLGGNLRSVRGVWRVGIAGSDLVITLSNDMACATSAEYFRGKHIYDGRTGQPVSNNVQSVTIIHPNSAMLADGLSTVCFILGHDEGEEFLKKYYPEAKACWIFKE